jgi:enamine deaminase RidA (YjgF/YER057c/UK114 family)
VHIVNPPGWKRPRGYSNGIVAQGRVVAIAGQIGWNDKEELVSRELVPQLAQALRNVVAVVESAGGTAASIVQMTIFVTDVNAYRNAGPALGEAWREVMGKHYPTMALLGISELVEPGAIVEITALAVLEGAS